MHSPRGRRKKVIVREKMAATPQIKNVAAKSNTKKRKLKAMR